MQKTVSDFITV